MLRLHLPEEMSSLQFQEYQPSYLVLFITLGVLIGEIFSDNLDKIGPLVNLQSGRELLSFCCYVTRYKLAIRAAESVYELYISYLGAV